MSASEISRITFRRRMTHSKYDLKVGQLFLAGETKSDEPVMLWELVEIVERGQFVRFREYSSNDRDPWTQAVYQDSVRYMIARGLMVSVGEVRNEKENADANSERSSVLSWARVGASER